MELHRIHLLLGQNNNQKIFQYLKEKLPRDYLVDYAREDFKQFMHINQIIENFTALVKKILIYYFSCTHRERMIYVL